MVIFNTKNKLLNKKKNKFHFNKYNFNNNRFKYFKNRYRFKNKNKFHFKLNKNKFYFKPNKNKKKYFKFRFHNRKSFFNYRFRNYNYRFNSEFQKRKNRLIFLKKVRRFFSQFKIKNKFYSLKKKIYSRKDYYFFYNYYYYYRYRNKFKALRLRRRKRRIIFFNLYRLPYYKRKFLYFRGLLFYNKRYFYYYQPRRFFSIKMLYHKKFLKKLRKLIFYNFFLYKIKNLFFFKLIDFIINKKSLYFFQSKFHILKKIKLFLFNNNLILNLRKFQTILKNLFFLKRIKGRLKKFFSKLRFKKRKIFRFLDYNKLKYQYFYKKPRFIFELFQKKKKIKKNFFYYKRKKKRKIKLKYIYKFNIFQASYKILNLFNLKNFFYYNKFLKIKKKFFKLNSKKFFIKNFFLRERVRYKKGIRLKKIFYYYRRYRTIHYNCDRHNLKHLNLKFFLIEFKTNFNQIFYRYLDRLNEQTKNNYLLFCVFIRGFTFNPTLNDFIIDFDYFSNKIFNLLSLFSIFDINTLGNKIESNRSRRNFLFFNYFKTIKSNLFSKLTIKLKSLKKKTNSILIKRNIHKHIYKLLSKTKFIKLFLLYTRNKYALKQKITISKRFLFKYLGNFFSDSLFKLNFHIVLFGFNYYDKFLFPMIKIIQLKKFQNLKNLNQSKYQYIFQNKLKLEFYLFKFFKFLILQKIVLTRILQFKFNLFFIYSIYLKQQIKKLLLKKILCHN